MKNNNSFLLKLIIAINLITLLVKLIIALNLITFLFKIVIVLNVIAFLVLPMLAEEYNDIKDINQTIKQNHEKQ